MDSPSNKRRRVLDRLSDLPDCLLHSILSHLGSRQAAHTSALSRRWRHLWRDVPCADLDEREFVNSSWVRFEDFADHLLTSIPPETQLDAFRLNLARGKDREIYLGSVRIAADRWIRRGLQHFPAAVDIRCSHYWNVAWRPYESITPESPVSAAGFTHRLTTLRLVRVGIMDGFGKDLGRQCPVLQELYLKRCDVHMDVVASPTLTSLTIIRPRLYGSEAGPLRIIAPRLASMLLKLSYVGWKGAGRVKDGAPDPEPLALLAKASIQLMGLYEYRRDRYYCWEAAKLLFIQSMCCFLALLPNVANLRLSGFTVDFEALLKKKSLQFPPLHNLKTLLLEECGVGTTFQILTSILRNTPNLEKLGLHHCIFLAAPPKETRKKEQEASKSRPLFLWCKKLKSIEIKRQQEDEPRMLKVLSEIRHGMLRSWWRKVMISSTIVERIE